MEWKALASRLGSINAREFAGINTVIHCAALTWSPEKSRDQFIEANVNGTANLLKACKENGVSRFILISYKDVKYPSNYAQSKVLAEDLVKGSTLDWLILRPAHIYGTNPEFDHFFRKLRTHLIQPILGTGKHPMHLVYVKDCARKVVEAACGNLSAETRNVIAPDIAERDYYKVLRKMNNGNFVILPTPLFLARRKFGSALVDMRVNGLAMLGIANLEMTATPLAKAMREILEFLATNHGSLK